MSQRIYFDNAATTPLLPEVIQTIHEIAETIYGNPSSIHREGVTAKNLIEESRRILSNYLHTSPAQVFFTSCGTESNNMIIKSAIKDHRVKTIISSPIEHSCVLNAINQYATENNVQVIYLKPNSYGLIDIQELEHHLDNCQHPVLVSLMHTNNELGSTVSLEEISTICKSKNALFHSDTVQSIGLYDLDVEALQIDFISGSAHKFFGPKGIGFVYIKNPVATKPLLYGGSQERNLRAGTENIIGIAALAKALELSTIH
ncbi:MAG TPA: aminotransferase class V-fold PLP-dependent enzyme, partial [Saprospiraceae bacterium]|nr:aminotransferase class V-fold PLP-dependent enzyme [Saprospiraceae bacterium]